MSRRSDRAWEAAHAGPSYWEGGGEEYFQDYAAIARDAGLDLEDYEMGDHHEGTSWIDAARLMSDVRDRFMERYPVTGKPHLIAYIVVKCQRCRRRVDNILLMRSRDQAPKMYAGCDLSGTGPIVYNCECGRRGLQVSRTRVGIFLKAEAEKDRIKPGDHLDQEQRGVWYAESLHIDA